MAQLTLARFKGETAVNFIFRMIATFLGGLVGLSIWYIGSGNGKGNPYGIAATCAVFFPVSLFRFIETGFDAIELFSLQFLLFFRIYYPGPPITTLLTSVTIVLVCS